MSPSLNDPYTAVEGIDHLTIMLCHVAAGGTGPRVRRDADGRVLVAQPGPDLGDCVRLATEPIRRYGGHEPAVAVRLLVLLRAVAFHADADTRPVPRAQAERIRDHAEQVISDEEELGLVRDEARVALAWIDGDVVPEAPSWARL